MIKENYKKVLEILTAMLLMLAITFTFIKKVRIINAVAGTILSAVLIAITRTEEITTSYYKKTLQISLVFDLCYIFIAIFSLIRIFVL